MGWSALSDDHHERGEITDLTHEGYRLLHALITFTHTPQRMGHFTRLDAAGLARLHGITDVNAALEDLLRTDRPHIEDDGDGIHFHLLDANQYHHTSQASLAGQASAKARREKYGSDNPRHNAVNAVNGSQSFGEPTPTPTPTSTPVPSTHGSNEPPVHKKGRSRPDIGQTELDSFTEHFGRFDDVTSADVERWLRSQGKFDANKDDVETVLVENSRLDLSAAVLLKVLKELRADQQAGQTGKALLNFVVSNQHPKSGRLGSAAGRAQAAIEDGA